MSMIDAVRSFVDRLVSGFAKFVNQLSDPYVLVRVLLIIAVFFLAGRVVSARRAPEVKEEVSRDPIDELIKMFLGSDTAPDVVNLVIFKEAMDFITNLISLIEGTELIHKELYFPKPALERMKGIIAEIQMKINEVRTSLGISDDYRGNIQEIIESSILEFCSQYAEVSPVTVPATAETKQEIPPEEAKRKKVEDEFAKMFEGEKKEEDVESWLKDIVDIIESYGI